MSGHSPLSRNALPRLRQRSGKILSGNERNSMPWSVERFQTVTSQTAFARDVVQTVLVWVSRGEERRRVTLELKLEASFAGRKLDPEEDLTPFLQGDEPPLHLFVTSEGVVPLVPRSD
jgi:hypothetical protein